MSKIVNIESDTEYKLCKKCAHCANNLIYTIFNNWQLSKCNRHAHLAAELTNTQIDLVSGKRSIEEIYISRHYCDFDRDNSCGVNATYFKPRKSIWQKIFKGL